MLYFAYPIEMHGLRNKKARRKAGFCRALTLRLSARRVGVVPIRPFGAELVVNTLHHNLGVVTLLSGAVCGVDSGPYCRLLRRVRAVVLAIEADLPLAVVKNDEVLRSRHLRLLCSRIAPHPSKGYRRFVLWVN